MIAFVAPFSLSVLIALILSLWLAIDDWRYQRLSIFALAGLFLVGILAKGYLLTALILGGVGFSTWRQGWLQSGDVFLLISLGIWIPVIHLPWFCVMTGILIILAAWTLKIEKIPLAPLALVSFWLVVSGG